MKIHFAKSRFDVPRGFQLEDGRIIVIVNRKGMYVLAYDTPFKLNGKETTLNKLKAEGRGKEVTCYDRYDIYPSRDMKYDAIIDEFQRNGFNVTKEALWHNHCAWKGGFKSGYRDEANGYFLFSPCGENELYFSAMTLNDMCADWQKTYLS